MILQVKFICNECYRKFRDCNTSEKWEIQYEWDSLTDSFNHIMKNPEHRIEATAEINL